MKLELSWKEIQQAPWHIHLHKLALESVQTAVRLVKFQP
jgi:hypothetical protein